MAYTEQSQAGGTAVIREKKGKETEGEGGREEDSNLEDLFQGVIREKRAISDGLLEEEGLIQRQERTLRLGREGPD